MGYRLKMKESQKRFLMGNFIIQDQWENQEQDGKASSEGHVTYPRNKRVEESSGRQRRMETSSEGDQGPEGAVAP
jgi:hypothetical protein